MEGRGENSRLKEQQARYQRVLENLTIMSDIFMRKVFQDSRCTEYVLQVIMEQKNLRVMDQVIQKDYKNLQGRSAILDCVAIDEKGKQFNVEIQQSAEGASPKRARYHSGLMDMNTLKAGQDFEELPETHVIFITGSDVLGHALPIYHIERRIRELENVFNDEAYIVYVNSSCQEDTELGQLMRDFHCKDADEIRSSVLARRVRELKESQEGIDGMCKELEMLYNEGIEEGRKEGMASGEMKKAKEMTYSLAEMGLSAEKIAEAAQISVQQIQKWLEEKSVLVL